MAMASPALYEAETQIRVLGDREHDLRKRRRPDDIAEELSSWVRVFELSLVFATAHEAIVRLDLRTSADVIRNVEKIDALVETLCRLNPDAVFRENAELLAPYRHLNVPTDAPVEHDSDEVVRSLRSLLLHCPLTKLRHAGRQANPSLAHRFKVSFDGIRAYVTRHGHPRRDALGVAGHAYAEGRLSIDEVATILHVPVADAVALLEEQGFRRTVEGLRLTETKRAERLAQIRADRLARGGVAQLDERLVVRDVVASQRIEDIDARPWLPR